MCQDKTRVCVCVWRQESLVAATFVDPARYPEFKIPTISSPTDHFPDWSLSQHHFPENRVSVQANIGKFLFQLCS